MTPEHLLELYFREKLVDKKEERQLEEQKKEVEALMETAVRKGRSCSMSDQELKDLFLLVLEE